MASTTTTTTRLTRLAALTLCPVAVVSVTAPSWANDPAGTGASPATRAGTGALTSKSLSARTVLTSTSGKKLTLTISASGTSRSSSVMVGLGQGTESHMWTFRARAADLKIGSTGAGTLTLSSTQTGSRGRLSLKFSPTDPARTKTCGGKVATRTRKMAVSGIAYVKTGTKAWGNVGRSSKAITFKGANLVTWSYDTTCSTPPPPCAKGLTWSAFRSTASTMTSISGFSNGSTASVSAFRSVTLSTPAGATRLDLVTRSVPLPAFTQSGSSATLTARSGTGNLELTGDGGFSDSHQCRSGSTTRTAQDTSWYGAATNGSPAFQVAAQVFGAFGVPNGSSASIGRQTF